MPLLRKLLSLLPSRSQTATSAVSPTIRFLESSRLIAGLIFLVTVIAIMLISYQGVNTAELPLLPGQSATVSVHSGASFSFPSKEQTRLLGEKLKNKVPPVYRLEMAPYEQFRKHLLELLERLQRYEKEYPSNTPSLTNRRQVLAGIVEEFNRKGPYRVNVEDVAILLAAGDAAARALLVERSLVVLNEIYREGTHDQALAPTSGDAGSVTIFQVITEDGEIVHRPVLSLEEALILLRVNLTAEGMPRELSSTLFRVFRNGLVPNILFDKAATDRREGEAIKSLKDVTVNVERGQLIIEAGSRVTAEQHEMLVAHRDHMHRIGSDAFDEGLNLLGRVLMVLAMVAACLMYIHLEDPETLRSNSRVGLLALVLIVNLALVRLTYSLLSVDFFLHDTTWAATLPFLAPTALAPLIVAILIDVGSAMFMALFISLFTGVIYGNRFDVQVLTFLASVVAIHGCRSVRQRGSVVRAATAGALVLSFTTLLLGLVGQTPFGVLMRQMCAGLLTGIVTGVAVVGLLPVLESLFRRTTDITLLELTDYNHPLMRTMQMEAPGTYHHSLVVAQLSENAAASIGANPLLARVCALYHDIGKTASPEFFSENQSGTRNPHDQLPPEESARIIRAHVTDGLALAHKHKLPLAVREVIQEHHGRTLIRFFYVKARQQAGLGDTRSPLPDSPVPATSVDEAAFRHRGELPSFKESAIISLADCVEAASRSLKQLTPQGLNQLIDTIVTERLREGHLDKAPITLAEIAKVKESFGFTLLNMLHSRIEYPKPAELGT